MIQNHQELMNTAQEACDAAKDVTLAFFRGHELATQSKAKDFDPVTKADRGAEKAIRAIIEKRRPNDAIIGEEYGEKKGTSGFTWVLDPIDGTRSFISGAPCWGTLIAFKDHEKALLGMIDQPYIGERFVGGFGEAYYTGPRGKTPLGVRPAPDLSEAILFSTFPEVGSKAEKVGFDKVSSKCKLTRFGMDCYAYALLAAGQIDLVIEAGLHSYDILAPIAVIEAAGGIVTNWQGGTPLEGGRIIAAASKTLHEEALEILKFVDE